MKINDETLWEEIKKIDARGAVPVWEVRPNVYLDNNPITLKLAELPWSMLLSLDPERVKGFSDKIPYLESIMRATRAGLGEKFYRDHEVHMKRVALLAHFLAWKIAWIEISRNGIIRAALFHDIAQPITAVRELSKYLCDIYYDLGDSNVNFKPDIEMQKRWLNEVSKIGGEVCLQLSELLSNALTTMNHGALSSYQYYRMIHERFKELKIAEEVQAIALHDGDIKFPIKYSELKMAFILILADELQEWDRQYGADYRNSPVEHITLKFEKEKKCGKDFWLLNAGIDYSNVSPDFSPLTQIVGKIGNLQRLIYDDENARITIKIDLPAYQYVKMSELFSFCTSLGEISIIEKLMTQVLKKWNEKCQDGDSQVELLKQCNLYFNKTSAEYIFTWKKMPSSVDLTLDRKGLVSNYCLRRMDKMDDHKYYFQKRSNSPDGRIDNLLAEIATDLIWITSRLRTVPFLLSNSNTAASIALKSLVVSGKESHFFEIHPMKEQDNEMRS